MKTRILRAAFGLLILAGMGIAGSGCNEDPPQSLYNPAYTPNARPVVTSFTTVMPNLAGVTIFTITGANFSAVAGDNIVFYNASPGTILNASPTQLRVRVPYLIKDTVLVRIAVKGATMFSDPPIQYKLEAPDVDFGLWKTPDETYGVALDALDSVYASTLSGGVGVGVLIYKGDGTSRVYSPALSSAVNLWTSMKFGPGGILYTVARNAVFRISAGGGTPVQWLRITAANRLADIDFDANNILWACGTSPSIFRIRTTATNGDVKAFPCAGDMRAVRVYAGYLYVGGLRDGLEKVFRYPIVSADSLGPEQEYFNLTGVYGVSNGSIQALTFNTDGDMYIGTDNAEGIRLVHADKSSEAYYSGVILPKNISFAWSSGARLYVSRTGGTLPSGSVKNALMWLDTQKSGAPTYGR
jgi:hypothetical protein